MSLEKIAKQEEVTRSLEQKKRDLYKNRSDLRTCGLGLIFSTGAMIVTGYYNITRPGDSYVAQVGRWVCTGVLAYIGLFEMPHGTVDAIKKRRELKKEVQELEQYLALY